MICHRCERALFMHAHGELGGVERFLLQCHLEGCDECRARWAKAVVEKDQLRRALSPMPTLDPEGERRLRIIGARIRAEQRLLVVPAPAPASAPAASSTGGRGRRLAGMVLAAALLAIALTAMAASWGPSLLGIQGVAAPTPVPLGQCTLQTHCPNCGAPPANAPGAATPGTCGDGNAPAAVPAGKGATIGLPHGAGASCTVHAPGAAAKPGVSPQVKP